MYIRALKLLPQLNSLQNLMSDFEQAEQQAFRANYPGIRAFGCFFHFLRAVDNNAVEIGLKRKLNNKETPLLKAVERFKYIAFTPIEHVRLTFDNMLYDLGTEWTELFGLIKLVNKKISSATNCGQRIKF